MHNFSKKHRAKWLKNSVESIWWCPSRLFELLTSDFGKFACEALFDLFFFMIQNYA